MPDSGASRVPTAVTEASSFSMRATAARAFLKLGHSQNQIRPLRVETGQYWISGTGPF
jgi:hypothetical protein